MSLTKLLYFAEKNKITEAEKKIKDVIIAFNIEIIDKKVNDIAEESHVTHSTVTKFIKKMGFVSWNSFITSILFEEKIKSQNSTNSLNDKINLEIENVKLYLRTNGKKQVEKIVEILLDKEHNFVFYGKRLSGNIAQYLTWIFTSNNLFGTHTYFLEELWGIINEKSVLLALSTEETSGEFEAAIIGSRQRGAKVISIIIGKNSKTEGIGHYTLSVPTLGYFNEHRLWPIIQNEILRFVGIMLFEVWYERTKVPKK